MQVYQKLLEKFIEEGVWQKNRTNLSVKFIPSAAITLDLRCGFPALTTKKLNFRQSILHRSPKLTHLLDYILECSRN